MFFIKLLNYIRGYIIIIIEGVFPERFLNICARRGIYLWNVKRIDKLSIKANVSVRGFKLLRPIAKKSRCRVYLKRRRGVPFFIYKHRNRKAFIIGAVLFAVLLFIMTRFIWVIEITGNETVQPEKITEALESSGLKIGVPINSVNIEYIQNNIMMQQKEIAWIGIHIKGTSALVEIKERAPKPDIFPKDEPCNIVAASDGVIESIDALNGQRLVNAGDVVKKGQLIVSGALDSKMGDGVRYVHADAEVFARTWHEVCVEIPKYEEVNNRTGRAKSKHMLKFFNFYVKLFLNDGISYEKYDRISDVKKLSLGNNIILPFSFHYDKYYEIKTEEKELDYDTAVEKAKDNAFEHVKGMNVIDSQTEISETDLKITYECLENIAQKKAIIREVTKDNGENAGGRNN